jgi:hypothetical protein
MRIVSFDKEMLNITIYNQYTGLELTTPVYFSNSTTYCVFPGQQKDTNNMIGASFRIDFGLYCFKGGLLYKLQRKHTIKTDNQSNSSTAPIEDTTTNIHLLVVWSIKKHDHNFCVCLIECADDSTWDEDKLWALYKEYNDQPCEDYESNIITWSAHDGTLMKTKFNIRYRSDCKLDITISEGTAKYHMFKPMKIDPKRLVVALLVLIVLIYTVRFCIQPSVKLNIHNRCLDVDLVSPTYITGDRSECHRAPDYEVCAGGMMRSGFIFYKPGNKSDGALIYRLQKHGFTEIGKNTSSAIHILIIWKISKTKNYM